MARFFSKEEARAVVFSCRRLREELSHLIHTYQHEKETLVKHAKRVITDEETSRFISLQLVSEKPVTEMTTVEAALICSAYRIFQLHGLARKAAALLVKYNQEIAVYEDALMRVSSSFGWLFSGKKTKSAAETAYPLLIEKTTGSFNRDVRNLSDQFADSASVSDTDAMENAQDCWEDIRKIVLTEARDIIGIYQPPLQAAIPVAKAEQLLTQHLKAEKAGKTRQEETVAAIRERAGRAVAIQTYRFLEKTEVETLNQVQGGIRTKLLREHGYCTVTDVFHASPAMLSAISGIGTESAKQIWDAANEMATNLTKTARLSLSTDDKSQESSNLLVQIRHYLRTETIINHYRSLLSSPQKMCRHTSDRLAKISNHLVWLLKTEESKRMLARDCVNLNNVLSGNYPVNVASYFQEITANDVPDAEAAWEEFVLNPEEYYRVLEQICPGFLGNNDPHYGLPEELAKEIQNQAFNPNGLNVHLRRYQEWGVKYILHQQRVLLGDEMGLGKTIQAIAVMISLRNTGCKRFFVVCPASVLSNWCREIEQKSDLKPSRIHGPARNEILRLWMKDESVAVTTYEALNTLTFPEGFPIDLLVVDEAHYIKNSKAIRTQNVHTLIRKAKRVLLMTGTALENKVDDMLSLLSPLRPSLTAQARKLAYMSSAPQFRSLIAPVYYRRKREDVLTELPEMTEVWEWCDLLPEERKQYTTDLLRRDRTAIRRVSWTAPTSNASAKIRRMLEIVDEAESEGRKVLIFSFYLETISLVQRILGERCMPPIIGAVSSDERLQILDQFESMPARTVLPLQIQAGGIGMNIQAASVVIICEPQLKPSVEQQAISRVYRMGQTRKVLVYHLMAPNTLDERIHRILNEKQAIFDKFADPSAAAEATQAEESKIAEQTMNDLIQEEINRIKQQEAIFPNQDDAESPAQSEEFSPQCSEEY